MAEIKKQQQAQPLTAPPKQAPTSKKPVVTALPLFAKDNYKWMVIGGIIIILGMVLMSGGKTQDPNTFDPKMVYSTTRITIAPILIVAGLLVEVYAIFRKPKQKTNV